MDTTFIGCVRVEPTPDNRWAWFHHKTELPPIGVLETDTKYDSHKEAVDAARAYIQTAQIEKLH